MMYASVGHGGASGYLAVMALFSLAPESLKPTALLLNIVVAGVGSYLYLSAKQFSWKIFWPFVVTSIPASFIGGTFHLPPEYYRPLLGLTLFYAAWRLFVRKSQRQDFEPASPSIPLAMIVGGVLGFASGLIGVGGGIFLSPLMILLGWARVREVSGIAALFILVNSISGLIGHMSSLQHVPEYAPLLAGMALVGGSIGALCGSRHLPVKVILQAMAGMLVMAGGKMFLL
ncbi:MAG: sulfite exporter TauE/SafE family protein [Desulfuromonadales bacterium]|nr:sulfite exporter TauE/SafE family protein [Desulfuromonadales bacterium]NIS42760.1 sulfite exporter TauE/SafE family protein [Desulfuromonadales bacterium]